MDKNGAAPFIKNNSMNPLKKILLLSTAALLFASCEKDKNCGSGVTTTEERDVAPFDQVVVQGRVAANIQYGPAQHVSVRTDAVAQPRVHAIVQNSTLYLTVDDSPNFQQINFDVNVEVPVLHRLTHSGISLVQFYGAQGPGILEVVHDGVGELDLNGSAVQLVLTHTGVGQVKARDMSADTCQVVQTGVGNIELQISGLLQGTLSGVGNIYYHGSPAMNVVDTGVGNVIHLN